MKFIEDENFNNYIDKYKGLPLKEKKLLVENQIKELIAVLNALNEKYDRNPKILFNREILDLEKEDVSEEDFVEAMFVYSYSIKELIASLVDDFGK